MIFEASEQVHFGAGTDRNSSGTERNERNGSYTLIGVGTSIIDMLYDDRSALHRRHAGRWWCADGEGADLALTALTPWIFTPPHFGQSTGGRLR